jgi:hypothetical protein
VREAEDLPQFNRGRGGFAFSGRWRAAARATKDSRHDQRIQRTGNKAVAGRTDRKTVAGVTTSVLLLSLVQPLHGLTFALLHLACMRMMAAFVPVSLCATAQSIYAFGAGVTTAALTLLSGILYARYGGASFFPMAVLCGIALPLAWFGFANPRKQ